MLAGDRQAPDRMLGVHQPLVRRIVRHWLGSHRINDEANPRAYVDFGANQIIVRDGKGRKDRLTMLPESLKDRLLKHFQRVRELHQKDLAEGWGKVVLPHALNREYKSASGELGWQFFFPARTRWLDARAKEQGRHHIHERNIQKAVRSAVKRAEIVKHATPHLFRHSFSGGSGASGNRCIVPWVATRARRYFAMCLPALRAMISFGSSARS